MTPIDDNATPNFARLLERVRRARLPLAVAALVFFGLWAFGPLAIGHALVAFIIVAFAAVASAGVETPPATRPSIVREPANVPSIDAVLSALPDPVIALARGGEVMALNAQARAIAPALRRGEPVSLGLRNPEILDAVRRARIEGAIQHVELIQRVPVDRWFDVVITPIARSDAGADLNVVLLTFHDLTPLRRAEEMRADFIANASHELRTPLAALLGFIETLLGPAKDDSAARERFLTIMLAQANRMARLIGDLLSLSRIELNAHMRPDKEVDLVGLVRQVVDGLQMLAGDRSVEVKIVAPPDSLRVLGDRDELLRVFENLVENALKYAASGKRIEVAFAVVDAGGAPEARVSVRDYGPGIAPEHLPRLTERFYRVDVVESRALGGTGLGLALVKHILNRHRGRLAIESTLGQGATFTIVLPIQNGDSTPG